MTLLSSHSLVMVGQGFKPRSLVTPKSIFFSTTLSRFALHFMGVPIAHTPLLPPPPQSHQAGSLNKS